jgi:hypothetical protein
VVLLLHLMCGPMRKVHGKSIKGAPWHNNATVAFNLTSLPSAKTLFSAAVRVSCVNSVGTASTFVGNYSARRSGCVELCELLGGVAGADKHACMPVMLTGCMFLFHQRLVGNTPRCILRSSSRRPAGFFCMSFHSESAVTAAQALLNIGTWVIHSKYQCAINHPSLDSNL